MIGCTKTQSNTSFGYHWITQPVNIKFSGCSIQEIELITSALEKTNHLDFKYNISDKSPNIEIKSYQGAWTKSSSSSPTAEDNIGGRTDMKVKGAEINSVTIWMNSYILEDNGGYPTVFQSVFLHEYGHAMGMIHSNDSQGIMNVNNPWKGLEFYSQKEINMINERY